MAQTSFALMTNLGRAKEAAALANATTIEITHIAIGDGTTVPSGGETALYHEVARKTISGHGTVVGASNVAYFDAFLAADDGPYTIREAGLIDSEGDLIAIARYDPPISKPVPASGQTVEGTIRLEVAFSDVANLIIKVDPAMKVALQRLTRLPWVPVISMSLATPPVSPAVGDTYVIAVDPTGSWVGQAGKIAEYTVAGWAIIEPPNGHGVSLPDGRVFERVAGLYIEKIALDVQSGKWVYAADTSVAANTVVVAPSPPVAELVAGLALRVKVANTNNGDSSFQVAGLAEKQILRQTGDVLADSELTAGSVVDLVYDGAQFRLMGTIAQPQLRRQVTYYVNSAIGNDANDGSANVAGKALATLGAAVSKAFSFGPSGFAVDIRLAAGTYAGITTPSRAGPQLNIIGNVASPASVLINGGSDSGVRVEGPNVINISGCKATAGGASKPGFAGASGGTINVTDCEIGVCAGAGVQAIAGAATSTRNRFSGNCAEFFVANNGGTMTLVGAHTIVSAITVSDAVAHASALGSLSVSPGNPISFVNPSNVTGRRYVAAFNGTINTQAGGANFFPGTVAGTTSTGGQYA